MTLSDKGMICDICGDLIDEPTVQPVELKGIPVIFHIHRLTPGPSGIICEHILRKAALFKNWKLLPDCYLKEAYRAMINAQALLNVAEKEGGEKEVLKVAAEILKTI